MERKKERKKERKEERKKERKKEKKERKKEMASFVQKLYIFYQYKYLRIRKCRSKTCSLILIDTVRKSPSDSLRSLRIDIRGIIQSSMIKSELLR